MPPVEPKVKIFITGILGFVGQNLAWHLAKQGHDIIGLIHDFSPRSLQTLQWERPVTKVHGDVRDIRRIREIFLDYKPDWTVHLAAQALVGQAEIDPYSTWDVNVNGTITLLTAWQETGYGKFLYFSTDKVYGNGLNKKETDPVVATGIYESSKAAADLIAQSYLPNILITRTCNIYGPSDRNKRIIPNTIHDCVMGRQPWVFKNSGQREYIYIADVCEIISKLLNNKAAGVWNVGSGLYLSNEQVVLEILKHFPKIHPLYKKTDTVELKDESLNTEKLCGTVDCLSFTTFPAGIKKTVDWWVANP
jgi:nucleoside-diphosphate-sugar epimerase